MKKACWGVLALLFCGYAAVIAGDSTIAAKIQMTNGGNTMTVISGGTLALESGATYTNAATSTFSGAVTFTGSTTTIDTSDTLAVTTADKLTVGGVIVPQYEEISVMVNPHASLTEQNLYTATEAVQVVAIRVVPDLVQGGALTGTVVKATGTATPANGTTPMHTANAIDFNATAHTVQSITLSATTADLQLAAGERIGLDLSAALTTGRACITIRYKRI